MDTIIIPFSLTATQVNLLDTTPVTLFEFGDYDSKLVRVPVRLEILRAAGTSYTITRNIPGQNLYDDTAGSVYSLRRDKGGSRGEPFSNQSQDYISGKTEDAKHAAEEFQNDGSALLIRSHLSSAGSKPTSQVVFRVPSLALLQPTVTTGLVAFPYLDGNVYFPGRNTFTIMHNSPIASGTGAVTGRIFFKEYTTGA